MERPHRLLFVCTANICRSPMAEGIARVYAAERGREVEVQSAGILGFVDRPADPKAVTVCREQDVDVSGHRSQGVSDALVAWADYILVMELRHAQHIRSHHPEVGDKMMTLGSFGGMMDIGDPVGGWTFKFRRSRDVLRRCVENFIDRLPRSYVSES